MLFRYLDRARAFVICGLAAGALLGAMPATAADTWEFYIAQSAPTFATVRGDIALSDQIDKDTKGELKVKLHLGATLQINTSNITAAVGDNIVQMGDDIFFTGNIPIGGILRLPMLIRNYEEFAKASDVLRPYMEAAYGKKGVLVLGEYYYPLQVMWSRKKLTAIADISGQKIRVASPELGEFIRRFGGVSVTMGATEVASALDRGVVDGLITAGVGAELWKDLLKYGYILGLNFNNSYIIVNRDAFEKLPPAVQATLRKTVHDSLPWFTDTMKQEDGETIRNLSTRMTVTTATADEAAAAAKMMAPYWDEWAKARGGDAVEALAKVRVALGR